jgi:hypothetical protein
LRRAIRAKTITAKNRPSTRRFEWDSILLTTLIAGDVKSLALAATSSRSAKVRATRITTRLTAFRVSQVPFLIVLLFTFGKGKSVSTFGASDFHVWHIADLQ